MKSRLISGAALCVALFASSSGVLAQSASNATATPVKESVNPAVARRVTVDEIKKSLEAKKDVVIVDVRGVTNGQTIEGAVHVPHTDLAMWAKEQPKDRMIVTYCTCHAESSAAHAVVELQKMGFTNAYALLGGLSAWSEKGLPITKPAP